MKLAWRPSGTTEEYDSAFFTGHLFTDFLTFGSAFTTTMLIDVASEYGGLANNGILGIGPARLSAGAVKDYSEMELETVITQMGDVFGVVGKFPQ
ncbi:hypothetical protein BDR04DRAFT_1096039 [Suillus decipiens]|nr:hypothetical protein BDR04DRAFT_1096039 [Suillus decipiens]